ncbi:hypothetical protein BM1_05295 [Bipolaris maydis]|nr:hypothetical protein BM1_05295 [Bipolaris maydis]
MKHLGRLWKELGLRMEEPGGAEAVLHNKRKVSKLISTLGKGPATDIKTSGWIMVTGATEWRWQVYPDGIVVPDTHYWDCILTIGDVMLQAL